MYEKVLITGQMRSGTTFLSNFLNAQEGITMYSDIFHVVAGKFLTQPVQIKQVPYNKPLTDEEKNYILQLVNVGLKMLGDKTDYVLKVQPSEFTNANQLYDLLLSSIACEGDRVVGHKVTEVEVNVSNLLANTDKKVIYIVRDPRDQVVSSVKKFGYNVINATNKWIQGINNILSINSDRLFIVKFEELIGKNENLKERLAEFLNTEITYDIEVARQHKQEFIANSTFEDIEKLFDPKAIARWKKRDEFVINYIYLKTGIYLDNFEYETMEVSDTATRRKNEIDNLIKDNQSMNKAIQKNNQRIQKLLE